MPKHNEMGARDVFGSFVKIFMKVQHINSDKEMAEKAGVPVRVIHYLLGDDAYPRPTRSEVEKVLAIRNHTPGIARLYSDLLTQFRSVPEPPKLQHRYFPRSRPASQH